MRGLKPHALNRNLRGILTFSRRPPASLKYRFLPTFMTSTALFINEVKHCETTANLLAREWAFYL
jgi:hypothetical protein